MTIERVLTVELGERSYPIYIGSGLIDDGELLRRHVAGNQALVVTNEVVRDIALDRLLAALAGDDLKLDVFTLADGESQKNLQNYAAIMDFLIEQRHNRTTTLLALGGGVVGDLCGFVAATYQRGVNFLQLPTTLLAQVDSSVGGKTAVNHPSGKNLIGAFHQPVAVVADLELLKTLPSREFRAGLAEVVKYGVISDAAFFERLEADVNALLAMEPQALAGAVARSCEIKADIVARDERETGVRALLNYGHTFGHALEALTGYNELLHGEAVAIGMVMAADLAWRARRLNIGSARRIRDLLEQMGLPVTPPEVPAEEMLAAMGMDKKVVDGTLRLILPSAIGAAIIEDEVDPTLLGETLLAGEALCRG
jgi:3-dehydroquinate synthase